MAKSKTFSVMDKMAMYMNDNSNEEIKSIVNVENETVNKKENISVEVESEEIKKEEIAEENNSKNELKKSSQLEVTKEEDHISNTRSDYDTLFRTKDYDMFIPYPKEELRLPLHTGSKFAELRDSLIKYGMNTPIKVIKAESSEFGGEKGKLIVLGGHNRLAIAKEYNLDVLYYILPITKINQTDVIMAEEVFLNRQIDELLPSQVFNLLKAMYSNGSSIREISAKLEGNSTLSLGKSSIANYLKLESIIDEFKKWVDEERIPIRKLSNFAKIDLEKQKILYEYCQKNSIENFSIGNISDLVLLKDFNGESLDNVFQKEKPAVTSKVIKIHLDDIQDLIPKKDLSHATEIIKEALKQFYAK